MSIQQENDNGDCWKKDDLPKHIKKSCFILLAYK